MSSDELNESLKRGISENQYRIYPLTDEQLSVVREAQAEVKSGKFLTDDEANKETDVWLSDTSSI